MTPHTKAACLGAISGFFFALGWVTKSKEVQYITKTVPGPVVVHTETQVQTKQVIVDHYLTKTVTVTVKDPTHGTTTQTQTVETTANKTAQTQQSAKVQSVVSVPKAAQRANWMIGADWTPRLDAGAYQPTGAEVDYRLVGPAWVGAGFDWHDHETKLSVKIEF